MRAQRIAGLIALGSGLALVVGIAASAVVGPTAVGNASTMYGQMGAGMMTGTMNDHMGTAMMSGGMMGFGSSGPAATAIPGATEVRVRAANFRFEPSEIRLPTRADVNLTLDNPAPNAVVHDLTVPALGIHVAASAGETRTVGLRDLPAGRYEAYCSVPGHAEAGMRAIVSVE